MTEVLSLLFIIGFIIIIMLMAYVSHKTISKIFKLLLSKEYITEPMYLKIKSFSFYLFGSIGLMFSSLFFMHGIKHIVPGFVLIRFVIALAVIVATRALLNILEPITQEICNKNNIDSHSCYVIHKFVRAIIIILGGTIALQNLGIDVSMLIAAFGITGIVVSYGMKDIVANFIASILLLGYKNIKINDYIKLRDWEGTVVNINLRYTTLEHNSTLVLVPNIILYTQPVAIIKK